MRQERTAHHEKVEIHGRADSVGAKAKGPWDPSTGGLSEAWNRQGDILQLEEEVRWNEPMPATTIN